MILITFPNGRSMKFKEEDFEFFGGEMEHKTENIILGVNNPHSSFVYETDWRGEIINKENISYQKI